MDDRTAEVVARRFCGGRQVARIDPHPVGHIHDTWFVTASGGDTGGEIVVQRLNNEVFPDCVLMMDNVLRVTAHMARRDPNRPGPVAVASDDGSLLVYGPDGRPWRAFTRVPRGVSPAVVTTTEAAHQVGCAFGRFLADVQCLPGPPLVEAIPGFKDFERRRQNFEFIVDLDPFGRVPTCQGEIQQVRQHHRLLKVLAEALDAGWLPTRTVHNDAKASNVLLDEVTGEWLCVIDLDTVAPGLVLFDVGDLLRSATLTTPEDARDLDSLAVRDNLLAAVLSGYLAEAGALLTDRERSLISLAGPLMAYESAMRFLTDHLAGDAYFRIDRPRHNLERARAQLRVLAALEHARDRIAALADA